ncbi:Uncharacterised protein [Enterobacter cloacae]|nr:Uncharacterised protein [Enterobacter cloacae]
MPIPDWALMISLATSWPAALYSWTVLPKKALIPSLSTIFRCKAVPGATVLVFRSSKTVPF